MGNPYRGGYPPLGDFMLNRNEAQTRRDLIDPKLFLKGWTADLIKVERTAGGIDIIDGKPQQRKGKCDYLLCLPGKIGESPLPIAILEAKRESSSPALGLKQSKEYSKKFNVPFAFSTNGHLFVEYDEQTEKISKDIRIENFPTPQELKERFENYKGIKLDSEELKPLFVRYKGGEANRRYYQDAAIRATLLEIAQGRKRILLSLATGTGKTYMAKQLLYKIAQAGHLRRALFLCDRDELRTNGIRHMQDAFGDDAQIITTSNPHPNARVLVSTYQTLNVTDQDSEPVFWKENFTPNYFSHIIIDECHRSAWNKWSVVLTDNPDAIQIGLTATPRLIKGGKSGSKGKEDDEHITANNFDYFGDPVYEYTITQGQDDGYLAACEVVRRTVDLDKTGLTKKDIEDKSAIDPYTGELIKPDEIEDKYTAHQYERSLLLDDRKKSMSQDLFDLFLDTGGPLQKTIIFCATDYHAEQIAIRLNNIYIDWCKEQGKKPCEYYVFKCTEANEADNAKDLIPELRASINSHFIATTVDLLSTGVDIPNLQNVVFFKYVESPISFYQMVGRGTRIGEPLGSKLMFRVYDYTNATRLFGEEFASRSKPSEAETETQKSKRKKIKVLENEFEIQIENSGTAILTKKDGKEVLIPLEEYKKQLAIRLLEEISNVEDLRNRWINYKLRRQLLDMLPGGESAVRLVRLLQNQQKYDLYDVLAELTFGYEPVTRDERVKGFYYKSENWLKEFPADTQEVLKILASQFERGGIEELENETVFDLPEIVKEGGFNALVGLQVEPQQCIQQTKLRLLQ